MGLRHFTMSSSTLSCERKLWEDNGMIVPGKDGLCGQAKIVHMIIISACINDWLKE
jgi:hypothetical protein